MNVIELGGEELVTPVIQSGRTAGGWISEPVAGLPGADFFVRAEGPQTQTRLPASLRRGKHWNGSLRTPFRRLQQAAHSLQRADTEIGDGLGESARIAVRRVFEDLSLAGHLYR